ncbi:esterase/lipase superfamily enzyme [Ancylobacter sp. 3268]|uniref:alpha/beta hydrolase n=1 Tax=Ancylobacter sp. 3268 TaxID=2817752 RepID=UPI00285F69D7|nr:alpha/beta hydrolase [Ancylobacter sp. 3268]MDR6955026.1 esterase/lipase superfamily enzyme [Ancylobacter sp. 3268]
MARIYYATNRRLIAGSRVPFGNRYNAEGPAFYRVGYAEVDRVPDAADPDDGFVLRSVTVAEEHPAPPGAPPSAEMIGSTGVFASMTQAVREESREVIAYIHGFNSSFETCILRAAQLEANWRVGGKAPLVFAFSWPADDGDGLGLGESAATESKWKYFGDRDDAEASGKAIGRSLKRLIDFLLELRREDRAMGREPCGQKLHLVTHSMGNWALRHALLALRGFNSGARLPKIFTNAFLMAADEDADALEHNNKLGLLPQLAEAIHVYHARRDLALIISDTTKLNPDRLGAWGPRTFDGLDSAIYGIDCADVCATGLTHANHQYYRIRPEVIADVRQVMAGKGPDQVTGRVAVRAGRQYRIKPRPAG